MNTETIIEPDDRSVPVIVPMDLMQRAVTSGADIAVLEKLMGLQERYEANQARKAFDAAMSTAKARIPVIEKTKLVDYTSNKGRTRYRYEDLADIAETVDPILGEHGLSYRFRTECNAGQVTVTCIVSHRDGHSETNTLAASHDQSGNKNSIQAIGSTVTYLQRYTLKAALGLAASADDDAQAGADTQSQRKPPPENEDQYAQRWRQLIDNATDDVELGMQWASESDLRQEITWRRRDPAVIFEAVQRRIEALQKKHADLQSQRLEAQDQ